MVSKNLDASIEAIEHTMEVTHRTLTRQSQEKTVTEEQVQRTRENDKTSS